MRDFNDLVKTKTDAFEEIKMELIANLNKISSSLEKINVSEDIEKISNLSEALMYHALEIAVNASYLQGYTDVITEELYKDSKIPKKQSAESNVNRK